MAFIWETDGSGNRTDARLAIAGGTASVSWNYEDPDPDVDRDLRRQHDQLPIPHANQCGTCHINDDKEPGDSPIGAKVRLLNRPMDYGSGPENQLQHWIDAGLLSGRARAHGGRERDRDQRAAHAALQRARRRRATSRRREPGRLAQMTRDGDRQGAARARAGSRPTARTATTATASRRAPACSSTCSGT